MAIRPHLRHCTACRAEVRELHLSRLRRASLLFPVFAAPEIPAVEDALLVAGAPEPRVPDLADVLEIPHDLPGLDPEPFGWLAQLKHDIAAFFHRAQASDVATGVHIAASGGGGRIATVAAILGLCLSGGAGVATVCAVTVLVSDPFGLIEQSPPPRKSDRPRAKAERPRVTPTPTPPPRLVARTPVPTATATPPRRRSRERERPARSKDSSQGTKPASHENPPIAPAATSSAGTETFSPEVPQAPPEPAAAPATGGGEFAP